MSHDKSFTNELIHEKSPYLLQHAYNPVNWYPWSDRAFAKAETERKPVFLSIGYATCHWCHVMEKESFEDEAVAALLNENFVCIKVDREERPDIDAVYMTTCAMLTGGGGWPLNLFMTPDKKPFFAATYIPKQGRFGRAGLIELAREIRRLWDHQPDKVLTSATTLTQQLGKAFSHTSAGYPDESLMEKALQQMKRSYDPSAGGFDAAPKFPTPHRLLFLLRSYHHTKDPFTLEMVTKTLTAMRLGGIWDHVGFGFHRYATDANWLLPHFEKMLYDQALIALSYIETFQITQDSFFADTARDIFTYVRRDMTSPEGAFYAAEDADSEGEEGKFYVWTEAELRRILGEEEASRWQRMFRVSSEGNFLDEASHQKTGANILHLTIPLTQWAEKMEVNAEALKRQWEDARQKLFDVRKKRIRPLRDDKVLADWNGLMIAALAQGARTLNAPEYTEMAEKAARFILAHMRDSKGELFHRYREGEVAVRGQANDYAFLIFGLISLYQTTFNPVYVEEALTLQQQMMTKFWDPENGGFFSTAKDNDLPVRPKDIHDGPMPSANSIAFFNLLCLARITGQTHWEEKADALVRSFSGALGQHPTAFPFLLVGLDFALHAGQDIVITGDPKTVATRDLISALNQQFLPNKMALVKSHENADRLTQVAGYTDGLAVIKDQATAYICKNGACRESTTDIATVLNRMYSG